MESFPVASLDSSFKNEKSSRELEMEEEDRVRRSELLEEKERCYVRALGGIGQILAKKVDIRARGQLPPPVATVIPPRNINLFHVLIKLENDLDYYHVFGRKSYYACNH
ncbi:hypothetical protein IEQ34_018209 [Dendrobium chrysotoxum]|uniref:Uncharacterized protein n=1 Tax=Dendrobium chrysotoxum TaxID=161865 RepID=A0AAV7FVX9_DENCH|nr:hypothetical protein IEQ34_018209 [Dendrobium chrysotoxum]